MTQRPRAKSAGAALRRPCRRPQRVPRRVRADLHRHEGGRPDGIRLFRHLPERARAGHPAGHRDRRIESRGQPRPGCPAAWGADVGHDDERAPGSGPRRVPLAGARRVPADRARFRHAPAGKRSAAGGKRDREMFDFEHVEAEFSIPLVIPGICDIPDVNFAGKIDGIWRDKKTGVLEVVVESSFRVSQTEVG